MRRRTRWVLLFVGIFVIVWLLWVGARVTDRPGFCASCHFMEPYVANWESSSHVGVGCIDCHYEKGFFGYLAGKARLVSEMLRYWAGAYNVRPHARVSDVNCLECHSQEALATPKSYTREIEFSHAEHYPDPVRGMELACSTCHSELVQGSHTAVNQETCIDCHFIGLPSREPLGGCEGCHGPPKDALAVDGIVFNHSDYLKSGVDCLTCHVHVTRGSGDVPPQKCYACHVERFERYGETELVHRVHVAEQQLTCRDCHTDVEHGKFELIQALSPDCRTCHGGRHSIQEELYIGTGGRGVPATPDPMFLSGVTCSGCHRSSLITAPPGPQPLPQAEPEACVACHGAGYDRLLADWQASIREYLGRLQQRLAQTGGLFDHSQSPSRRLEIGTALYQETTGTSVPVEAQTPSDELLQEAQTLYERAQANIALVERDRSGGAHNIHYINRLLKRAEEDLVTIPRMLVHGSAIEPGPAELYRSQFGCTRCHEGIARESLAAERGMFGHGLHLNVSGADCDACHAVERENHSKTFADARDCTACHPTAEGVRGMGYQDCLMCHEAAVPVESKLVRFSHEQHVSYGCGFCHQGAQTTDHLEYLQSKRPPEFNHKGCARCHERDLTGAGDCTRCHVRF